MADREFREQQVSLPSGWEITSRGTIIGNDQYKPDLAISYKGAVRTVAESSSTNDRKAAVGELLQAHKFFCDSGQDGKLILCLCGTSTKAPRPDTQADYLRPYFQYLYSLEGYGLKSLFLLHEDQFRKVLESVLRQKRTGLHVISPSES